MVYSLEIFLAEKEHQDRIEEGSKTKEKTNIFFLPSSTTGMVVHHEYYSLSYSEAHEQAEWVAYELKKEHVSNSDFPRPYFEMDQAVKTGSAHWRNYKNSGYDRGHLCPAADRQFNKRAHDETFLTSNITPQDHEFNSGVWNRLEWQIREWALKHDGVFVVTGGILNSELSTIGNEKVAVPNFFYKVVLDYNNEEPKMIAFLLPHRNSNLPLRRFEIPVDSIEKLTGINFFEQLNDTIEDGLEASKSYSKW